METQWLPVSLVVWIAALAGTLDARQQRGSSDSVPGCCIAPKAHPRTASNFPSSPAAWSGQAAEYGWT